MFKDNFEFNMAQAPQSLVRDIKRAARDNDVELNDAGELTFGRDINFKVGGVFDAWIDRSDAVQAAIDAGDTPQEVFLRESILASGRVGRGYHSQQHSCNPNLIPDAGLNALLMIIFGATAKISTWYQGPFTSNSTPGASWASNWAGASSGPLATELANAAYNESNRQAAAFGAAASKSIATSAPTTFTIATGQSGITLYGSTLNSDATVAYNATDKVLMAATRFTSAKSGLGAADVVNISYTITGSST
jgi:hypothetical protein